MKKYQVLFFKVALVVMGLNLKSFIKILLSLCSGSLLWAQVASPAAPLPLLNKQFQVVAHIVMDKDSVPATPAATVTSVMNTVNTYFSPIGVSFNVCEFRYIYNFQYHDTLSDDMIREMKNQNFAENRINIYYFNAFKSPGTGGKCFNSVATNTGFIGIRSNTAPVVAHELGHYFSLAHTFGAGPGTTTELVNGSNCTSTGDHVCDTPADPYTEAAGETTFVDVNDNCNFIFTGKDTNGEFYNPDIGNIMSYYVSCSGCPHFTHGQLLRMANYYNSTFNSASKDRW